TRRPRCSTLCPYTTLFRSAELRHGETRLDHDLPPVHLADRHARSCAGRLHWWHAPRKRSGRDRSVRGGRVIDVAIDYLLLFFLRSEEHTSELQSREQLVCR